jgi:hypothetical protein
MRNDPKARVFVSHNSKDKPFVRKLVEALKEQSKRVARRRGAPGGRLHRGRGFAWS